MLLRRMRVFVSACFAAVFALLTARSDEPFSLRDGDKVLFIGDTFFEREVDYGWIETELTTAFPDRNVTFRNLGWAADSPMGRARASFDWNKSENDWLNHVKEQIALVKPTVAFLSYGMTASFDGEAGIAKYKADLGKLMDAVTEVSGSPVRFALVGPIAHENHGVGGPEIDSHNATLKLYNDATKEVAAQRNCAFVDLLIHHAKRSGSSSVQLTDDQVTPNRAGNREFAAYIADELKLSQAKKLSESSGALTNLVAAIRKKNELFFHRWRPENWTYLFGFRKGEQGRNSVEIPQFDPLIAEWEARIAKLRHIDNQDPAAVSELHDILAAEERDRASMPTPKKPQPVPTFDMADGFEATLWAESPELFKPIQINFDARGRLWVASSRVYPQIRPGQEAQDSIVILEDTKGAGKADKSTVFAEGLLIPSGVLPDCLGGCYVAASHQLLHFRDTDNDGQADEKQIVMSSFGTEDTHHNLHTLRWGYDGHIYLNQSIYTHTHIETPHGIATLNSGGIWRFDPATWTMEVYARGGCNPWGHHWDQYGTHFFTDGAGFKGVYHAMEGATYFTYSDMRREAESISPGNYPKFASLEIVHSPQFPPDWENSLITCDFRAHRVVRFTLDDIGSSYQTKEMPDLMRSTNVTFRPIDVRFGPDGALYVADWSNPIIQHGEVDFRDPRRDHEHGRIWRITAKGRPLSDGTRMRSLGAEAENGKQAKPSHKTLTALFDLTLSPNAWEQQSARNVLHNLGAKNAGPAIADWLAKQTDPRSPLEALWVREGWGLSSDDLIAKLVASPDSRLRAAAAHALSHPTASLSR